MELLDLYPTLTELAGLPHYMRNEGTSLTQLLDDPDDARWTKPALSQVTGGRSVRTERYRYTEWQNGSAGRELYDHTSDPSERINLAEDPRYAGAVELLRAMLPPEPVEPLTARPRYNPASDCYIPGGQMEGARPQNSAPASNNGAGRGGSIAGVACDLEL